MADSRVQVQYCMTSDGVSIAYTVAGEGAGTPLIVLLPPPFSHLRDSPVGGMDQLRGNDGLRRVASMDFRGCGLSDKNIEDVSMDALALDLDAVIERLGWEQFALFGMGMAGPLAMKYTAEHPERVQSLILRETYARAGELGKIPRLRALGAVLREDWDTYVELMALTVAGWDARGAELVASLKDIATPESVRAFAAATPTYNASAFVEKITTRSLVVGRDDMVVPSPDMLRQLGARIRNARVVMVGGGLDVAANVAEVVEEFLAEGDEATRATDKTARADDDGERQGGGMAVVLFVDVVDSTGLTERMGDAAFRSIARALDEGMRSAMRDAGGSAVEGKVLGDGVMGVFASASAAIEAARQCAELSAKSELRLHVGLHAGDVIHEGGNVYGGAVNIASRVCGLSAPGEILVSGTVRELARTSTGVVFEDRGEFELKGVGEPVRVYAVRSGGDD